MMHVTSATNPKSKTEEKNNKSEDLGEGARNNKIRLDELIDYNQANFPSNKANKDIAGKIKPESMQENTWDMRFHALKEFKRAHGHLYVSKSGSKYNVLARWMQNQRRAYACFIAGKPSRNVITYERVRKLEEIGFHWSLWDEKFEDLLRFKKKYGHFNVPQRSKLYPNLQQWISRQRLVYKSCYEDKISIGKHSMERMKKLKSIGFY